MCECARVACEDAIDVPANLFEQVRDAGPRYIVAPDHVLTEIEQPIEQGDGWIIVEKIDAAARAAEEQA